MDTLSLVGSAIVGFLFVLTVVVFFHEFGHFLVARWCGVAVNTFSIGFGPEIWGFTDRKGTRWRLSWIPLGGYVKFIDDENPASAGQRPLASMSAAERKVSFQAKPVAARAAIVAAGPIANFLLTIAIFAGLFAVYGEQVVSAKVDIISPNSAAERAGFKPNDKVLSIDGRAIDSFSDMQQIVSAAPGIPLKFVVERGQDRVELTAIPEEKEINTAFGKVTGGVLGIQRSATSVDIAVRHYNPIAAVGAAVDRTYMIVSRTLMFPFNLARGRESADQIGGPIMIAQMSGKLFSQVIANLWGEVGPSGSFGLLFWIALISSSIGAVNLFPIPMLDGGHLLFYLIEALRGRPLSQNAQEVGFRVGLGLILILMVFAFKNDFMRVWS